MFKLVITAAIFLVVANEFTSYTADTFNVAKDNVKRVQKESYSSLNSSLSPLGDKLVFDDSFIEEIEKQTFEDVNLDSVIVEDREYVFDVSNGVLK